MADNFDAEEAATARVVSMYFRRFTQPGNTETLEMERAYMRRCARLFQWPWNDNANVPQFLLDMQDKMN